MEMRELVGTWVGETERFAARHELADPNADELRNIIEEGLTNKAGICGLLGLHEGNQYRMLVSVQETEEQAQARLRPLVDFLEYLNTSDTDACEVRITENRYSVDGGRNWLKITRQVVKQAPTLLASDYSTLNDNKRKAYTVLERLFNYHSLSIENLGTRLGELIAAKSQVAVISANWLDFIMASDRCSYQSCYKPLTPRSNDVNHFNGCVANFRDGYTLISYLVDQQTDSQTIPSRKSARAWLQVHAGLLPYVIWGREYGSWNSHSITVTREPVLRLLRELYCVDRPRWVRVDGAEPWPQYQWPGSKGYYPGYHDESHWSVYRLKGHDYSDIDYIWKYETGCCWNCGSDTDYTKGGSCEDCSDTAPEYSCDQCGEGLNEDEIWSNENGDGTYCRGCYRENYVLCDTCGYEMHRDDGNFIHIDGCDLCEDCYSERYGTCEDCGGAYRNDHLTDIGNGSVCESCLRNYFRCDGCDEYFDLDDATEHDNAHYCSECYAAIVEESEAA